MKIAFVTEDEKNISLHFGRAPYYLVVTVEDGRAVDRELRDKLGHRQFSQEGHAEEHHTQPGAGRGTDPAAHDRHIRMVEAIRDCEAVICAGMGMGAYNSMRSLNIRPIVTDLLDIDQALQAFIEGKLDDKPERLH